MKFRKDVSQDNIKSNKKPRFLPLFRRHAFRETTVEGRGVGVKLTTPLPPAILGLNFVKMLNFFVERCLILMAFLEEMVIRVTFLTFVAKDF